MFVLASLAALLLVVGIGSLFLGSTRLSWSQLLDAFGNQLDRDVCLLVFQLRLPRVVMGVLMGVGVAVSGVLLQGLSRNDLASPDTVGVNAGTGLGMILLFSLAPSMASQSPTLVPFVAMLGAVAVTSLVFALAYRRGSVLPSRLLLVGIAVSFGAHAATLLLTLRLGHATLKSMLGWMSGTLSGGWPGVWLVLPWLLLLLPVIVTRARTLDALSLGDAVAASLGVAVERQRLLFLSVATILTSACVAVGGHIGFLGLAAPHLARRLVGNGHGALLPAAALCGAILLLAADTLGRYLFSPIEIPAGVLVGVLGGVYFLYLLAVTRG